MPNLVCLNLAWSYSLANGQHAIRVFVLLKSPPFDTKANRCIFSYAQVNNYSHWCLDQMDFVLEKRVFFCVYTNHATCYGGNQILDESSCLTNWTVDHSDCISFDCRDWRWWNSSNRAAKGIVYLLTYRCLSENGVQIIVSRLPFQIKHLLYLQQMWV